MFRVGFPLTVLISDLLLSCLVTLGSLIAPSSSILLISTNQFGRSVVYRYVQHQILVAGMFNADLFKSLAHMLFTGYLAHIYIFSLFISNQNYIDSIS
jgi:hypothetical protein